MEFFPDLSLGPTNVTARIACGLVGPVTCWYMQQTNVDSDSLATPFTIRTLLK